MDKLPMITITEDTNCAGLTAELILDHFGVRNRENYLKLLQGLGQGLEEGTLCGAVSGGYFAINLIMNEHGAHEDEINEVEERFKQYFKEKFNSVNCGDILSSRFTSEDTFEEDVRQSRFCGNLLDESTTEIVELVNLAIAALNPIMMRFNSH